jgi:hypothetical protein
MPKKSLGSSQSGTSTTTRLIQSVFAFTGAGFTSPVTLTPRLKYEVPARTTSTLIYLRAGNSSAELIYLQLTRNKKPMRLFPIGAKSAIHVTLAIVEEIGPETELEIHVGAAINTSGFLVLDMGLNEHQGAQ